jgi:hypothetical protein
MLFVLHLQDVVCLDPALAVALAPALVATGQLEVGGAIGAWMQ